MDMKYLVTLSTLFFLIADCLSGCFDIGFQNCPPVADATSKPQGALGISINSLLRPATGVYSHPCSDTPHWHIPVPVLPVASEIPSAPSSFAKVSALRRTILESLSNIGKAVDITERKIKCLELQYFISEKKRSLSPHKKYVIHYFSFCNRLATSPGIERSFLCITHTKPKEPVPPRLIWI